MTPRSFDNMYRHSFRAQPGDSSSHRTVSIYLRTYVSSHATMLAAVKTSYHIYFTFIAPPLAHTGGSSIAYPSTAALSYTKRTSASTSRDNRHAEGNDKGNAALFTGKITTRCIQVTGPIAAFPGNKTARHDSSSNPPFLKGQHITAYTRQPLTETS